MSNFARGACCAVVIVLGLVPSAQTLAEEQADSPFAQSEKRGSYKNVEERIEAALDQPLKAPLDFTELPLIEIINTLQEEYNLPIVFDNASLDEVAISPETEITVNLRNITLRSALNLMFQQPGVEDLTYMIDNDVLLITTKDRADATLTTRMYRVDDFDLFGDTTSKGTTHPQRFGSLTGAITSCLSSDSWQANGKGKGKLVLVRPGILIVSNTREVQVEVERFLDQLRGLKTRIEQESTGSGRF